MVDHRKATISAKISAQIVEYYRLSITNCEKPEFQSNVGSKKAKVAHFSNPLIKLEII